MKLRLGSAAAAFLLILGLIALTGTASSEEPSSPTTTTSTTLAPLEVRAQTLDFTPAEWDYIKFQAAEHDRLVKAFLDDHYHRTVLVPRYLDGLHRAEQARLAAEAAKPKWNLANAATWDAINRCEAGGKWNINTGNGYYGGLQFDASSWRGAGGTGFAHQASREEQIHRANIWRAKHPKGWYAWPHCAKTLGLPRS